MRDVRVSDQQEQGAQADGVGRRLVPGDQQDVADPDELLVGQLVAVVADERAEDVVAGIGAVAGWG